MQKFISTLLLGAAVGTTYGFYTVIVKKVNGDEEVDAPGQILTNTIKGFIWPVGLFRLVATTGTDIIADYIKNIKNSKNKIPLVTNVDVNTDTVNKGKNKIKYVYYALPSLAVLGAIAGFIRATRLKYNLSYTRHIIFGAIGGFTLPLWFSSSVMERLERLIIK